MQSGVLAFSCHFSRLQIQSETFADNNHHTCFAGSFLLFNPYRSLEHEQMSGNNTKTKSFELCGLMPAIWVQKERRKRKLINSHRILLIMDG